MAELQPPEGSLMMNGVLTVGGVSSDNPGGGTSLGSKRQRRPSVRLGDIGDESCPKRPKPQQQWNQHHNHHHHHHPPDSSSNKYRHPSSSSHKDSTTTTTTGKPSKTRPLTNLSNGGAGTGGGGGDSHETLEPLVEDNKNNHHHPSSGGGGGGDANLDLGITNTAVVGGIGIGIGIGNNNRRGGKDLKNKRGVVFGGGGVATKRPRSNWVTKVDEGEEKFNSGGEDGDEWGYNNRDFDEAASESPLKEQSPINSLDNDLRHPSDRDGGLFLVGQRRHPRARVVVSESRDHGAVELDGPSDTDAREWRCRTTSVDRNGVSERGRCSSLEDGVQSWLNGLGLGRYAPVFEIHEVDEEVLPLLTLEDLRDMGINAVGSRRKMYCAIQKLAKGFS